MASKGNLEVLKETAEKVGTESDSDVFLYNGAIRQGADLEFIQRVHDNKGRSSAILILVTSGGNPHAAYKIARYMQNNYKSFTVLVSGACKSAGTLLAVGANCVAFAPYGELGPIDVQSYKVDNLAERQSGLTITESMNHLTRSAIQTHGNVFSAIMSATDAIISFRTAAHAASDLVRGLYAPIFSQIDPMEVGEKARSMRIASDYGKRLNARSQNLKDEGLDHLTQTYPSHAFVIDMQEAQGLFKNVRSLTENEQTLVECLEPIARHDFRTTDDEPTIICLSGRNTKGTPHDEPTDRAGGADGDQQDSPGTIKEASEAGGDSSEHPLREQESGSPAGTPS